MKRALLAMALCALALGGCGTLPHPGTPADAGPPPDRGGGHNPDLPAG